MSDSIHLEPTWENLLHHLEQGPLWRSLCVVGSVDSGKTTFCKHLGNRLGIREKTYLVDCDPGQSFLGPPGTLTTSQWPIGQNSFLVTRFIGATTPLGYQSQVLSGARRLMDRALEKNAQKIIIDTPGFIPIPAGREFQYLFVDLLDMDHLIALQGAHELESFLSTFSSRSKPVIHRLPVSEAVKRRSQTVRRAYRNERFREYFTGAESSTLSLQRIGFHGFIPPLRDPIQYRNRLIGLCDKSGFLIVIAILEEMNHDRKRMQIYSPPFDRQQVATVQFGTLRVDRSGEER